MQPLSSLSSQRGASVTSIVLFILVLGISAKLAVAILPAQVSDYQLTKMLSAQLKESNNNGETAKEFMKRVDKQLRIDAYYETKSEDLFTFKNNRAGELVLHKDYQITKNFFGNVDIVNRFEGDIDTTTAE